MLAEIGIALALAAWIAGCSRGTGPAGPAYPAPDPGTDAPGTDAPGVLEVIVTVEGTRPDADGYAVTLGSEDAPGEAVGAGGGTVHFPELAPGVHFVHLVGLAANCSVVGGNPRPVRLDPDQTLTVPFLVRCPGPGDFLISVVSQGADLDPAGYTLVLEGSSLREVQIGGNDSLLIPGDELSAGGVWAVKLTETGNCVVEPQVTPARALVSLEPLQVRVLDDITVQVRFTAACLPRSSRIAFQDGPAFPIDIRIMPALGGNPHNVTNHPATDMRPALSPDRSRIVFTSNRDGPDEFSFDLYAIDTDGGGLVRLTNTPGFDLVGSQAWSPDGSRIAFSYSDSSGGDIYVMNADGSGRLRITQDGSIECPPAWSPDGAWIAFCKHGGIYRMSPTPGSPMLRVVGEGFDPAWSPDGARIAYSLGYVWDWPLADLAVVDLDGTGLIQLHPNQDNNYIALNPSWSPDGASIAFARSSSGHWDIVVVPFLGQGFGEVVRVTSGLSPSWR